MREYLFVLSASAMSDLPALLDAAGIRAERTEQLPSLLLIGVHEDAAFRSFGYLLLGRMHPELEPQLKGLPGICVWRRIDPRAPTDGASNLPERQVVVFLNDDEHTSALDALAALIGKGFRPVPQNSMFSLVGEGIIMFGQTAMTDEEFKDVPGVTEVGTLTDVDLAQLPFR